MLPADIVFDILSLLPVDSLLRFRCLSKCFCALIDSPGFINFHLNQSIKTSTNRNLIVNRSPIYRVDLDSFADNMCPVKLDLQHMSVPLRGGAELCGDIFGSCNGLVPMYDNQGITIWNPSTKKHQFVHQFWTGIVRYAGFGYDVNTNDYKVIIITKGIKDFIVMVYSLRRNTLRRIKDLHTPDVFAHFYYWNSALVGSSLHWLVFPYNKSRLSSDIILAFDLRNETLSKVPTPPGVDKDSDIIKNMAELGGCLSVNCLHTCDFDVDIWIMKNME